MLHDHDDIKHAREHVRDGPACNLQRIPLRCASAFSALIKRAARHDDNATTKRRHDDISWRANEKFNGVG